MLGIGIFFNVFLYLLVLILAGFGFLNIIFSVLDFFDNKGYYDFLEKLKQYKIPIVIALLLIVSLIAPIGAWYLGFFDEGRLLNKSDLLGYYGAIIGGGVTVLGVYWTLNYESKKSKEEREFERQKEEEKRKLERERFKEEREYERQKEEERRKLERERFKEEREYERQKDGEERKRERERFKEERRKDSLPILRFNHSPNSIPVFVGVTRETSANEKEIYQIIINTSDESSVVKFLKNGIERGEANEETIFRIIEFGRLEIKNVGLGAAILSNVYLFRKDTREIVKNLQDDTKGKYIIQPNTVLILDTFICSNDFSKDDVLVVDFRDIYSNKYRYIISFENNFSNEEEKTIINNCSVDVLPTQIKK